MDDELCSADKKILAYYAKTWGMDMLNVRVGTYQTLAGRQNDMIISVKNKLSYSCVR